MSINTTNQNAVGERSLTRRFRRAFLPLVLLAGLAAGIAWSVGPGRWNSNATDLVAKRQRPGHKPDASKAGDATPKLVSDANPVISQETQFPPKLPEWPKGTLTGEPAKKLLLEMLTQLNESFSKIPGYTVTFRKQERLKGKLVGEQTYTMKVRQDPFAVYMKAVAPTTGKEVIFAKGYNDDKVIAHSDGLSRFLVPRLQVPPEHPLVRGESRHPITNAGIGNLIKNLIGYRTRDIGHPDSETTLDEWTDPDGRHWLRSLHVHRTHSPDRPFTRAEVLYHPETRLPLRFTGFDWPEDPSKSSEDLPILGERYCYDDLTLNAPLNGSDFDPTNPAYQFHRF